MGQSSCCCRKKNTFPSLTNNYLFQINRFIPDNDSKSDVNAKEYNNIINNESLTENLNPKKGKYIFLFYDIKQNHTLCVEKKLEVLKTIEGLSELNLESNLYLCGNSQLEVEEGSFLFEINPLDPKTKILVNSVYGHYYPSLISYHDKSLFCIGGKHQIHCEKYSIDEKSWSSLPDLPEERYRCTLCLDSKNDIIYLFGGINNKKQNINDIINNNGIYIENDYILRLQIDKYMIWEKIDIKNEKEKILLNRVSSASLMFDSQEDNIFIFGGQNQQKVFLDDIIKFNINSFSITKTNQKLNFPTVFLNQYAKKCDSSTYVFFDKFNNIIKTDEHDFKQFSDTLLDI